ncbi:hypothetical protein [Streptomyces sirii]|uniref:hypothetical protein n=1 Tax=Streptomyces sirii TaxID=3127701 RepID=UPI003D36F310
MTTDQNFTALRSTHPATVVFGAGVAIGILGGMIGLGGAEFRLPLLIGLFGFAALSAVILNKAMSLIVVLVALPARLAAVSAAEVAARWPVAVNLLAGSLLGAVGRSRLGGAHAHRHLLQGAGRPDGSHGSCPWRHPHHRPRLAHAAAVGPGAQRSRGRAEGTVLPRRGVSSPWPNPSSAGSHRKELALHRALSLP